MASEEARGNQILQWMRGISSPVRGRDVWTSTLLTSLSPQHLHHKSLGNAHQACWYDKVWVRRTLSSMWQLLFWTMIQARSQCILHRMYLESYFGRCSKSWNPWSGATKFEPASPARARCWTTPTHATNGVERAGSETIWRRSLPKTDRKTV